MRYEDVLEPLRAAYDASAGERDGRAKAPWKLAERQAFLARLQAEGKTRLLEVGAGTGQDSLFFQENGLTVVATDLSTAMVAHCCDKGLDAREMDFLHLDFPLASFDAVWSINCLLHVPTVDLPDVLAAIRHLLRPGGLFFLGVYGGEEREGLAEWDQHDPPRFFAFRTDSTMRNLILPHFEIVDLHIVQPGTEWRFQSFTLRRAEDE